jgi:homocysteine S-methyltransferase
MNPIDHMLREYPLIVLDGALATELEARGCDLHDPLWSAKVLLEAPALIQQVHTDYFAAGADCAITATYQATFAGFARRGLDEQASAQIMRRAVELALAARDAFWAVPANRAGRPRPLVAASIGPYGAGLADGSEYRGDYGLDEAALMDFHRPRMAVLAAAGADLFACETIPCMAEARALARLLAEFPDQRAWISFSARDRAHTSHGDLLAECASWLDQFPQIAAIGVNCTAPQFIAKLIDALAGATSKPIVVYPNSGETYQPEAQCWVGDSAAQNFADLARGWYTHGARLIGGCCRTGPREIQALASWARLS